MFRYLRHIDDISKFVLLFSFIRIEGITYFQEPNAIYRAVVRVITIGTVFGYVSASEYFTVIPGKK